MKETVTKQLQELQDHLRFINTEINEPIKLSESCLMVLEKSIIRLKSFIIRYKFKNQHEEIYFFKKLKPQFISPLIYYNRIYKIEINKPQGGGKALRKYYNNELSSLKQYFDENLDFYKYYRTNSEFLDHKYFVRGNHDIKLNIDSSYFDADHRFSTSHSYQIANIISNDQVVVYIESELANLNKKESNGQTPEITEASPKPPISWTGSKVALVELLYAFHSDGSFNNGNADVKQIAELIENSFSVELGQYSRTFLELRARKTGRTKYIDGLKDKLVKRMDDADDSL
jgi:hypothetical protein